MTRVEHRMDKPDFLWNVKHPEHEEVHVEAPDRLHAVAEAARAWGVAAWTSVARECEVKKTGPAPAKKAKPAKKPGTAKEGGSILSKKRKEAAGSVKPREYTPEKLEQAVNKYFMSITRRVARKETVPTGETDSKGHMIYEQRPIINSLGEEVEITEYILPPSVADLCQALGIHRSTWAGYCDHQLHPEFTDLTEQTRERMRAWNERELLTRPGKDIKGVLFNLQTNYGYGGEKREVELGPAARKALHGAPVSERAAMLKELLDELKREEYEPPGGACEDGHD